MLLLRVKNLYDAKGKKERKNQWKPSFPRSLMVFTLTAPFSPMRYETSPGSTHTDSSAGRFSKISAMGTPLSRAAISSTTSIGSPVFKHRKAEPWKFVVQEKVKPLTTMSINHKTLLFSRHSQQLSFFEAFDWGKLHAIKSFSSLYMCEIPSTPPLSLMDVMWWSEAEYFFRK